MLNVFPWLMLAVFFGVTIWEVIKGKPNRFFWIKWGMNIVVRLFVLIIGLFMYAAWISSIPFSVAWIQSNSLISGFGDLPSGTMRYIVSVVYVGFVMLVGLWFTYGIAKIKFLRYSKEEEEFIKDSVYGNKTWLRYSWYRRFDAWLEKAKKKKWFSKSSKV